MITAGFMARGVLIGTFVIMCEYATDFLLFPIIPGWENWQVRYAILLPLAVIYGLIGLTLLLSASTTTRKMGVKRR